MCARAGVWMLHAHPTDMQALLLNGRAPPRMQAHVPAPTGHTNTTCLHAGLPVSSPTCPMQIVSTKPMSGSPSGMSAAGPMNLVIFPRSSPWYGRQVCWSCSLPSCVSAAEAEAGEQWLQRCLCRAGRRRGAHEVLLRRPLCVGGAARTPTSAAHLCKGVCGVVVEEGWSPVTVYEHSMQAPQSLQSQQAGNNCNPAVAGLHAQSHEILRDGGTCWALPLPSGCVDSDDSNI